MSKERFNDILERRMVNNERLTRANESNEKLLLQIKALEKQLEAAKIADEN